MQHRNHVLWRYESFFDLITRAIKHASKYATTTIALPLEADPRARPGLRQVANQTRLAASAIRCDTSTYEQANEDGSWIAGVADPHFRGLFFF